MKQAIDKSKVMRRAWNIFRGNNPYSWSFSAALRRAWEVEKAYAKQGEVDEIMKPVSRTVRNLPPLDATAYYQNAERGQYFGD